MIDCRAFGQPIKYVIHDVPCLMASVSRYDPMWHDRSWRSERSSLYNWTKSLTGVFEFSICLEKGVGRYTVVDWHSIQPEVSLVYFTVKDNILEVRFDKKLVFSKPIVEGEWVSYKVTILFSPLGRLIIECEGIEVYNDLGRTLYADDDEAYLQVGVYQFDQWPDGIDYRRMYFQI